MAQQTSSLSFGVSGLRTQGGASSRNPQPKGAWAEIEDPLGSTGSRRRTRHHHRKSSEEWSRPADSRPSWRQGSSFLAGPTSERPQPCTPYPTLRPGRQQLVRAAEVCLLHLLTGPSSRNSPALYQLTPTGSRRKSYFKIASKLRYQCRRRRICSRRSPRVLLTKKTFSLDRSRSSALSPKPYSRYQILRPRRWSWRWWSRAAPLCTLAQLSSGRLRPRSCPEAQNQKRRFITAAL